VITRARSQAASLARLLEASGARVLEAPTIAIEPPPSWDPLDAALREVDRFRWVVFTSVNGVAMVDARLGALAMPWTAVGARRVAAIGPATADALREHGVAVHVVPGEYRAEALAEALRAELAPGDAVLLPRAARTRDVLVRELEAMGATVREVAAYVTRRVEEAAARLRDVVASGRVDVVTLTSSSTARHFAELFSEDERRVWLAAVVIASIGPITAATAAEYGLESRIVPSEYTIPALVRAIEAYFSRPDGTASGPRS
jgi:uroporphyrinogen III methyltransferase/synthase